MAAIRRNAAISATGRSRIPMITHFTMVVFPSAGEVGAEAGIVYGLTEA
jgi:hypothetical protein